MAQAHVQGEPPRRRVSLAEPWHRLAGRWRAGGVEEYSLGQSGGMGQLSRLRLRSRFELSEQRIPLENLSEAFCGFRIVHLSDIHHGLYLPAEALAAAVEFSNELEPDVVALTGDFVTASRAYIGPAAEILGGLRARYGSFAVLGNHDFRVGANEIAQALRRAGIDVLRNRHAAVRRYGSSVYFAGVEDLHHDADLHSALRGIPARAPTILLSHNPSIIHAAARRGISLVLAGHTHGGQVRIPVLGSIYGRAPERLRFKSGRDSLGRTQIYTSRGIGTVVLPLRFGCPAEIPQLVLAPARPHSIDDFRHSSRDGLPFLRPHARH